MGQLLLANNSENHGWKMLAICIENHGWKLLAICIAGIEKGEDMKDNCVCPRIYMPVCGEDGETYPNTCNADCAGTEVQCDGKCPCSTGEDYECNSSYCN